MIRIAAVVVSLTLLAAQAAPAERNLDRWFDRELLPFVTSQLVEHPRFKGESVMFVVLEDNVPASVGNELALSLRDRLLDAALNTPGVAVGRRQGGTTAKPGAQSVDCTRDDVHYYIGISVSRRIDGLYGVNVRALDLEDSNWVSGFGKAWQGALTTVQQRAMQRTRADQTFRGARARAKYPFPGMNRTCLPHIWPTNCRVPCCARPAEDMSSPPNGRPNRATTWQQLSNWSATTWLPTTRSS
jgi:hypothetical protein